MDEREMRAMLAAVAWAVGHTPQMRCTIWAASRG